MAIANRWKEKEKRLEESLIGDLAVQMRVNRRKLAVLSKNLKQPCIEGIKWPHKNKYLCVCVCAVKYRFFA